MLQIVARAHVASKPSTVVNIYGDAFLRSKTYGWTWLLKVETSLAVIVSLEYFCYVVFNLVLDTPGK